MQADQLEILKYITTFTLTVAFRASIRTQIPFLVKIIKEALRNNIKLALWLCEAFTNQLLIKEFFVDCTIPDMSRFTAGLLKTAMNHVYKHEKESLFSYTSNMHQGNNIIDYIKSFPGDNLVSHTEQFTNSLQAAKVVVQNP